MLRALGVGRGGEGERALSQGRLGDGGHACGLPLAPSCVQCSINNLSAMAIASGELPVLRRAQLMVIIWTYPFQAARGMASLDSFKQHSFIQPCVLSVSYLSGTVFEAVTTYKVYLEVTPTFK